MNTNLPPIFCLAVMIPSRTMCHAQALWVNQIERTMLITRSKTNECDHGNLSFRLTPWRTSRFMQSKICPPSRISSRYEDVEAREEGRMVISDGLIRGVEWHISSHWKCGQVHSIEEGDWVDETPPPQTSIPVRFKPVLMGFVSGKVDSDWMGSDVSEDWELCDAWHAATDWHLQQKVDHGYQYFGFTGQIVNPPDWEELLAAAEQCWKHMALSQVKLVMDYKDEFHPPRLADLWAYHRDCYHGKDYDRDDTLAAIDKIIASLGDAQRNPINFPALEKSLTRAVRRGRMTADRVRNVLTLLAAGTGFQPKPRKALAN